MKRIISILLTMIMSISMGTFVFADESITIIVDGTPAVFPDAQPFIDENDRTQVPIGALAEILNVETEWDGNTNTAYIFAKEHKDSRVMKIIIGDRQLYISERADAEAPTDGLIFNDETVKTIETIEMDTAAVLKDSRTFIPIRYVADFFYYDVEWDAATANVNLIQQREKTEISQDDFDFELLKRMPKDANYMVSPFSLKMALAMAANGANGDTRDEILKTLGISDLDHFNNAAIDFIKSSNESESIEFNIANSIWNNISNTGSDFGFSDTYKKLIEDYYNGAASEITNENGAKTINDWIALQTKDKIKDVITDDKVEECISFLVNTIYFKGAWAVPFQEEATKEDVFTDRDGNEKTTSFMNDTGYYSYFEDDNIQMLAKPYKDNDIKMYFVLPKNSKPLQSSTFENAIFHMASKYVNLKLPKFKTEYLHENLIDISKSLGINTAFDPRRADFWSMYNKKLDSGDNIFIRLILQKTFIDVDEKGTEAAAATVIGISFTGMPPQPIDFKCDRPFTYFIRNDATGDILFMGEYAYVE